MGKAARQIVHPILKEPLLYVVDPPKHLQWANLVRLLELCGDVKHIESGGVKYGLQRWTIQFLDLFHGQLVVCFMRVVLIGHVLLAEMALATLQGLPVPGVEPPWHLSLSHSATLESPFPEKPLCAQFVKSIQGVHPLYSATAQEIFRWFRNAGPLVFVRVNVDVGYPQKTCLMEYWKEEDAQFAMENTRILHSGLKNKPAFNLRTITLWSVLCTVRIFSLRIYGCVLISYCRI